MPQAASLAKLANGFGGTAPPFGQRIGAVWTFYLGHGVSFPAMKSSAWAITSRRASAGLPPSVSQ